MSAAAQRARSARVQLKVLLLGATADEPSFRAWQAALVREGTPHQAVVVADEQLPLVLADAAGACFQAVIVATGELLEQTLSVSARAALERLQREFGIRTLIAHAYPRAEYGLQSPVWAGPLVGVLATLTSSGRRVFPYLRSRVPIDAGSWGYLARPLSDERFETLLATPDGLALLGIHRHPDGRAEMIQTFASNPGQMHSRLLGHGQLGWVTRGSYLGHARNYLSLHVDDVLLPNRAPAAAANAVGLEPDAMIRMTADDAAGAARWSRANGLRLDLVCNGAGSDRHARETGAEQDPLLEALLSDRDAFGWINHTYQHILLDDAPRVTIEAEIASNVAWARAVGIELEPGALVTGGHTGLADLAAVPPHGENPDLADALRAQAVRFVACDASRPYPVDPGDPEGPRWPAGTAFAVGDAIAVPRHPTALPWYAASEREVLEAVRSIGGADPPASWEALLAKEARRILATLLGNDPRPHYFHQSNLVGGERGRAGLLCVLIDAVLDRYRELIAPDVAILQPNLRQAAELLVRWSEWRAALAAGSVAVYSDRSRVTIVNSASTAVDVPLTGTERGTDYGGTRSGWVQADPGETVVAVKPVCGP